MSLEAPIWTLANEISGIIGRWLEEHEGKKFFGKFRPLDLLRLTKLQVWSWRYRLDIEEILTLILPPLRSAMSARNPRHRYVLGVTVAALTGRGAEQILLSELRENYPALENRAIWRDQERQRQLDRERREEGEVEVRESRFKGVLEAESVADYIESYRKRALATRRRMNAELASAKRKRKRYRGNPWL